MCGTVIRSKMYRLMQLKPNTCPDCNGPVFRNGGCVYCPCCGWSSCSMAKCNHKPRAIKHNLKGAI